ncbi:unnamed protein product [Pleuronectes platessa]|uniref:Uncharacterized protein n=1 Tax=Pleuronectes platessa TaxID=8262 RepID=A0A9N7TQ84_PLEPL|nr:unnamed protein product [Pleuronectes platessa]
MRDEDNVHTLAERWLLCHSMEILPPPPPNSPFKFKLQHSLVVLLNHEANLSLYRSSSGRVGIPVIMAPANSPVPPAERVSGGGSRENCQNAPSATSLTPPHVSNRCSDQRHMDRFLSQTPANITVLVLGRKLCHTSTDNELNEQEEPLAARRLLGRRLQSCGLEAVSAAGLERLEKAAGCVEQPRAACPPQSVPGSVCLPAQSVSGSVCPRLSVSPAQSVPGSVCLRLSLSVSGSVCPRLSVSPAQSVSGSVCLRLSVSPAQCVSGSVCLRLSLSPAQSVPGSVCPRLSLSPAQSVSGSVCLRLSLSPAQSVSGSVCLLLSVSPAQCVSGSVCLRLSLSPAQCVPGSVCLRLSLSPAQCVSGSVCPRLSLSPAQSVSGSVCLRLSLSPAQCVSGSVCLRLRDVSFSISWTSVTDF